MGLGERLIVEKLPYHGAIGFHAQQAAEKFLKAYLVAHQVEFPKTHDLGRLLDLIAPVDGALATTCVNGLLTMELARNRHDDVAKSDGDSSGVNHAS